VAEAGAPALIVEDVSVGFGGLLALDSVSLSVVPGEIVGVIGPNGAGKTTLFNVVSGFVSPREGRIVLAGREMRRLRPHQLAKLGVGRTLQGIGLWSQLTVLENVMAGAQVSARAGLGAALLGSRRSSRDEKALADRARSVLEELQVGDVAGRVPSTLPYATQKRVALARTLVASPTLLLLDEPASGLSDAELASLGQLLRQLTNRMAIVLVEHHMDLVMSVCDRVVVLDAGRVIASGTPDEVKGNPAVTAAYLGGEVEPVTAGGSRDGRVAGADR
jgi:branched-chain amino acid transport system ATP-binding protein